MSGMLKSIVGNVYGRLTVMSYSHTDHNSYWVCMCSCGNSVVVQRCALVSGVTKSCGCLMLDVVTKHGMLRTKAYRAWHHMMQRCYLRSFPGFENYGGRGIRVENRWHSASNFLADMGEPSNPKMSLDRIDVNGNYCRSNCRWATHYQQCRNKRTNHWYIVSGKKVIQTDLAAALGVSTTTIYRLERKGLNGDQIVSYINRKKAIMEMER